ncbi:MAG: aminotransferase class IV [Dehalococcoidia bacterium]
MSERIAYFNGEYIRESEARISIYDRGFMNGDAAFDVARTFGHRPFKWEDHVARFFRSLHYLRVDLGLTPEQVLGIAQEVFKRNQQLLAPNDDYMVRWVGTPGEDRFKTPLKPTVLVYCTPIPFGGFARRYAEGIHLVVALHRALPAQCLDPKAKLYSRAHYALADVEAKSVDPNAYSLLLDVDGHVTEGSTSNLFMVKAGKLLSPTTNDILEGMSRATILDLAHGLGIETLETDLGVYDLYNADEVFISATSFVMLPVARLNTRPLGKPVPGPITRRLLSAWNELVGVDVAEQALSHVS